MVPVTQEKKRKQRSPFYTKVLKDGTKQKRRSSKIWYLLKITRSETGQTRTREYFATRKKAKDAEEQALALNEKEGLSVVEISPQLRAEAIKAADILAGKATLVQAAEYFMKHVSPLNEVTVQELFEKYRDYQKAEGASDSYMADINWRLGRFAEYFTKSKRAPKSVTATLRPALLNTFSGGARRGRSALKPRCRASFPP